MNRRQQINKLIHSHIEVDSKHDYTNYKELISAVDNYSKKFAADFASFVGENTLSYKEGIWRMKKLKPEFKTTEELLNKFLEKYGT